MFYQCFASEFVKACDAYKLIKWNLWLKPVYKHELDHGCGVPTGLHISNLYESVYNKAAVTEIKYNFCIYYMVTTNQPEICFVRKVTQIASRAKF